MGRLGHEYESAEMSLKMKTRAMPPIMGVLVALAVFFGVIFGTVLVYEGDELLGTILYIIAIVAPVFSFVSWRRNIRR